MTKIILLILFGVCITINTKAQITITQVDSIEQLCLDELIGSGIIASGISYTGDTLALGIFNGTSELGFNQGIIISTGHASDVAGESIGFASNTFNTAGCPELEVLSGNTTFDAAVFEFDFIPATNKIEMNYLFASEEYPEFVNSNFNDIFAFFLNGPNPTGGSYLNENIAVLPNSIIPVAINNVNQYFNAQYYVNNLNGQYIVFDGFTTELKAYADVIAGQQYHIKFAIADASDQIYDSGILIKKNSFKCVEPDPSGSDDAISLDFEPVLLPNASGIALINLPGNSIYQAGIFDLSGRCVKTTNGITDSNNIINTQELSNGTYIIELSSQGLR